MFRTRTWKKQKVGEMDDLQASRGIKKDVEIEILTTLLSRQERVSERARKIWFNSWSKDDSMLP